MKIGAKEAQVAGLRIKRETERQAKLSELRGKVAAVMAKKPKAKKKKKAFKR